MMCSTLQVSFSPTNQNTATSKSKALMTHFSTQGGLNLLHNGEMSCFAFEFKNPLLVRANCCGISKMRFQVCPSLGKNSTSCCSAEEKLGVDEEDWSDGFYNYDEDYEFERDELSCFRGLVLDISYRPVNVVCWKRAICLEFTEKADVLEYYDQTVNSPGGSFYIPAVLRVQNLLQIVKRRRVRQNLNRKNIFFRDAFTCQYCSSRESLTVDHVLPVARGGKWEWQNLVTACAKCNSRKGPKTLEEASMRLIKVPKAPRDSEILAIPLTTAAMTTLRKRNGLPNEWRQYLGLPSES